MFHCYTMINIRQQSSTLLFSIAIIILFTSHLCCFTSNAQISGSEPTYFYDADDNGPYNAVGSCTNTTGDYTVKSEYKTNLLNVFTNLLSAAAGSKKLFYNVSSGSGIDRVYGLFDCEAGLQSDSCTSCLDDARDILLRQCWTKQGTVYYGDCMLQYANHTLFSKPEMVPAFDECDAWHPSIPDPENLENVVSATMTRLIKQVSQENATQHFAVEAVNLYVDQKVYMFVQCRPDINRSSCKDCLMLTLSSTIDCVRDGSIWSNSSRPICQMRYGFRPFYNLSLLGPSLDPPFSPLPPPPSNSSSGTSTASDCQSSTKLKYLIVTITILMHNLIRP